MYYSTNPKTVVCILWHAKHGPFRDELQGISQYVEHMDHEGHFDLGIVVVQYNNPHLMLENFRHLVPPRCFGINPDWMGALFILASLKFGILPGVKCSAEQVQTFEYIGGG